jgi:cytochrome c oxidase assembly protein subunit 11
MTAGGGSGEKRAVFTRDRAVAATCIAIVATMVGMAFASVPLYRLYCQATGFAGTTQRAEKPSTVVLDRTVTVRFDANVSPDLPWTFEPEQSKLEVKIGENTLAFYKAINNSDHPITGEAVFNVTPDAAGLHFNKVQCFCFTQQTLQPGQKADMAVSFYLDPAFVDDAETKNISELTLSYTFYPVAAPKQKVGLAAPSGTAGRL